MGNICATCMSAVLEIFMYGIYGPSLYEIYMFHVQSLNIYIHMCAYIDRPFMGLVYSYGSYLCHTSGAYIYSLYRAPMTRPYSAHTVVFVDQAHGQYDKYVRILAIYQTCVSRTHDVSKIHPVYLLKSS